jgi:heterodisulfide reductase subunit A
MYTSKEALNIRKKKIPDCECYIFNTEKRGYGKQYYDMMIDAEKNWGVKYINGRVASVLENPKNNNLIIKFEDINTGKFLTQEFELVVLAAGLIKSQGKARLAQLIGSSLDDNGLFSATELDRLEKRNIFDGGFARFPMNIPDSIIDGSAIASKIAGKINVPLKTWEPPKEEELKKQEIPQIPMIGVFYCDFNDKILTILNYDLIKKEIASYPGIVTQEIIKNAYANEGRKKIQQTIIDSKVNQVLFISGSPRYYEDFFKQLLEEIGFNYGMMEIVDLREQNAYIHGMSRNEALTKAIHTIKIHLAKLKKHKPVSIVRQKIIQNVMVIGFDIPSIVAADSLSKQSIEVHLLQMKEPDISNLESIYHSAQLSNSKLMEILKNYRQNKKIHVYSRSKLESG